MSWRGAGPRTGTRTVHGPAPRHVRVPIVGGDGGRVRTGFEDGDAEVGGRPAWTGAAVVLAFDMPGDRRPDFSGTHAGAPVRGAPGRAVRRGVGGLALACGGRGSTRAHPGADALFFGPAAAHGPRTNPALSRRTSTAPAPPKCAGMSSSRSSAARWRIRRRLATACSGARQALLLHQGSRICTGPCSRSPTKTARSLPDASRSTDEPAVWPGTDSTAARTRSHTPSRGSSALHQGAIERRPRVGPPPPRALTEPRRRHRAAAAADRPRPVAPVETAHGGFAAPQQRDRSPAQSLGARPPRVSCPGRCTPGPRHGR